MGWKDLLQTGDEKIVLPWFGGSSLRSASQRWSLVGPIPREYGWFCFKLEGRTARLESTAAAQPDLLQQVVRGYLVGDRIVVDGVRVDPDPAKIVKFSERLFLLEEGLERFARVRAGRIYKDGPLIYQGPEFPLGPEDEVLQAFLERNTSVAGIKGVAPALDAAFQMEVWQRAETDRRRAELERIRREEEERRQREERRRDLVKKLGDGEARREMALVDFDAAAKAALAVGGAELLDTKKLGRKNEWAVKYRLEARRFECIVDEKLGIIDSGICLVDHDSGEKGDRYFTLESLPGVVRQAQREGRLVVFRHV